MLVFWPQRLVFLAVPKTGTTAWSHALAPMASMVVRDPPELKHAPLYRYNRFFRPMFEKMGVEKMELLAVVREPVSWLGSWYRFRQRPFLVGKPQSTRGLTFDEFVSDYLSTDPPEHARIGSQAKFLEPRPNGVSADHLFPYENPAPLLSFFSGKLDKQIDLPNVNASSAGALSLTAQTRARLEKEKETDFALWENVTARYL